MFKSENYINTSGNITAEEIAQQPRMWLETARIIGEKLPAITAFMERCQQPGLRICITGAGSSGYCAEFIASAANICLGCKADAPHTTDIVGSPESVLSVYKDVPTLLISLARSGNSPESVGAVEYARKKISNLSEICVTCAEDSALSRLTKEKEAEQKALIITLPKETCDRGFAMTSSFTSMAVAAYGILAYKEYDEFKNNVAVLASIAENKLDELSRIAQAAVYNKFGKEFDRAAFLGAGILKGIAHEASIKISELTTGGVNVVSDTPLGFRHGPKSMITDNAFTLHVISCDSLTRKYDTDLLREIAAQKRGNKIITVSDAKLDLPGIDYEVTLNAGFKNDFYFGVACVVFAQLFAFFKSQAMGIPTDNPCPGGELNRVVKGVKIYQL